MESPFKTGGTWTWLKPINTTRRNTNVVVDEPLSPAARLFNTPQSNCCIVALVGCKTTINVDVIKEGVNQTFVKHPRVSSKLTINDVVMGITQAGLSRYLNRKYGESKGDTKGQWNNLSKHIRIRSALVVNIRSTSKIEDLAEQMKMGDPKKTWGWGNSIGYILLPFDISLRDDPLDYIRNAKATIDKKKQSLEAVLTYVRATILLKTLGLRATSALNYKILSNTTLAFSNVVGPKEEISFYGHPMTFLAPSVYGHPQAITIHFQSYMNKMTLVLAVDQNVIPEPHELCNDIEEILGLVKQAVEKKKIFKI